MLPCRTDHWGRTIRTVTALRKGYASIQEEALLSALVSHDERESGAVVLPTLPARRSPRWTPRAADLRALKWAAAIIPALSLVFVDILRHTVLWPLLHTLPGFLLTYATIAAAALIFSSTLFGRIERLQRQVAEQNRQLAALNDIALAAAETPQLEDLLGTSLDRVLAAMQADAGLICLVDAEKEEHSAICSRGFSPELVRGIQRAKLQDDPVAQEVVRTGRPVVLERIFEDPRVAEVARREGVRSAISAPLKSERDVNGILAVATRQERRFSAADQAFLGVIGSQLGLAVRNADLYERSRLQNRELGALLAVGKAVTSSFDLDEVLRHSLDTLLDVTSADAAELWLSDDDDHVLRCHRGVSPEAFLARTRFRVGDGLPGLTAPDAPPLVVHDLPADAGFLRPEVIAAGFRTFGAVPLRYQGRLVGVLAVTALAADALTEPWELRLLGGIGEWVALAIENARLHQQVQDAAVLQERERIARELHDGLGQVLGYIITQTLTLKKLLADGHLAEAQMDLAGMEAMARELYADVREAILGLRTVPHHDDGLIPALGEYVARYAEATGIAATLDVSSAAAGSRLAPGVEIQVLRILQEALSNVRKHARATSVRIGLTSGDGELQAEVVDDGQGFEPARLRSAGWPRFGLQTMRERAESVGGAFSVEAAPGRGTRVVVRIPLDGPRELGSAA